MAIPKMKEKVNIRMARKEDAEEIYYLVQRAFLDYVENGIIPASREKINDIYYDIKNNTVLVLELNNIIIGSLRLVPIQDKSIQLRRFSIHPDYQGQGLGTLLYYQAEKIVTEMKYEFIFLYSSVESENLVSFYKNLGFNCLKKDKKNGYNRGLWIKKIDGE